MYPYFNDSEILGSCSYGCRHTVEQYKIYVLYSSCFSPPIPIIIVARFTTSLKDTKELMCMAEAFSID